MRFVLILTLIMIINPIFSQTDLQTAMDELLEYYDPEMLLKKSSLKIIIRNSDGKRLEKQIDDVLAKQILKADFSFYNRIFPGEIIYVNENYIGLTYTIICAAGGHCEYEKLAIIRNNGEFIADFEYGKYLSDNSGKLIKKNVYKSDSLMIFKTSDITINPQNNSISSEKIDMQTIHISDEGEIKVVDRNKIDTRRKYYWISTDIVQDSTLEKHNKQELAEMRNEIFASHGYIFRSEKWQKHFGSTDWYETQLENVNSLLSIIEKKNIEKILEHE